MFLYVSCSLGVHLFFFVSTAILINSNSCSVKHSGFLYLNISFSFTLRSSHPQSSPAKNFTAFFIPVAFVIFSTVLPKPSLASECFFFHSLYPLVLLSPLKSVIVVVFIIFPIFAEPFFKFRLCCF